QRRGGHDDLVGPDQAHRIDELRLEHVDVRQVARREPELHVERFDDDEPLREPELLELAAQLLRLRSRHCELRRHDQALLTQQLRQHRAHRAAVHLAVDLLLEIARTRRERPAAADPQRAADRADAGAARALLLPRLLAAAAHVGAVLLSLRSGASAGEIGRHDLMHERLVERSAERRIRELERATTAFDFYFHRSISLESYLPAGILTAGRTTS